MSRSESGIGTSSRLQSRGLVTVRLGVGVSLILLAWSASWGRLGALGEHSFFPLWLGYILTVDALMSRRGRRSLLERAPRHWGALFLLSAPVWWLFEGLNHFLGNWHYLGAERYSPFEYVFWATISFSTVIPAVFETAELVLTVPRVQSLWVKPGVMHARWFGWARDARSPACWGVMYLGAALLLGVILWPRYFFPAAWLWGFLLIDPLNRMQGRASLLGQAAVGDWRRVAALAAGALVCGFFWEMWNYAAWPKWYYTVPFFDWGHLFEMPLLGYLGYIPFAWELYALYHFIWGRLRLGQPQALTMDHGQ